MSKGLKSQKYDSIIYFPTFLEDIMPTKKTFIDKLGDFFTYIIGVTEYLGDTAKTLKKDLLKERGQLAAQSAITKAKTETILKFLSSNNTISRQIIEQKKKSPVGSDNEIIENAKDYGLKVVSGGETLPPKLKYGQGTICKRTRQNKHGVYTYWQGRYYENGKQKTVTAPTLKDCMAKMKKPAENTALPQVRICSSMTLQSWLNEWYQKYKRPNVKPSYAKKIETYIQRKIAPTIGNFRLDELTTMQLQEFVVGIDKSNTRKKIYDIIHSALRKACETRVITYNPAAAVEIKTHKSKKKRAYEFTEQQQMLDALSPKYKALFFFLCCTGLRISEFLALTENDIDKSNHVINVSKSKDITTGNIGTTKTERDRKVFFLDELFDGVYKMLGGVKFFGAYSYSGVKKAFTAAIKRLELKDVFIHSTRHTFSSVCYYVGIQDKQIQEWLGHATMAMTVDTYTHLIDSGESIIKDYIQKLKNARN